MEQVKEAFSKVKQDIDFLKEEIAFLKEGLKDTRERLIEICDVMKVIAKKNEESQKEDSQKKTQLIQEPQQNTLLQLSTQNQAQSSIQNSMQNLSQNQTKDQISISAQNPAHNLQNPTEKPQNSAYPAHKDPHKSLEGQNWHISTGNQGVPTDRQTNQQTNQQTDKGSYNKESNIKEDTITNAAQILDSLDNLKKEVRLKFKRLTDQEFSVFSIIYQLSEEKGYTDYKNLSEKLNLTESSIRDYVGRLIKKGIPVEKTKINNKTIHLSIPPSLKKVASLTTILQLRAI